MTLVRLDFHFWRKWRSKADFHQVLYIRSLNIYLKSISHILHTDSILVHCSSVHSSWQLLYFLKKYDTSKSIFKNYISNFCIFKDRIFFKIWDFGTFIRSRCHGPLSGRWLANITNSTVRSSRGATAGRH